MIVVVMGKEKICGSLHGTRHSYVKTARTQLLQHVGTRLGTLYIFSSFTRFVRKKK